MGELLLVTIALCWLPPPMNWLPKQLRPFAPTQQAGRVLLYFTFASYLGGLGCIVVWMDSLVKKDAESLIFWLLAIVIIPVIVSSLQFSRVYSQHEACRNK